MPPKIPKNNLKERMVKLGYNPDLAQITPQICAELPPKPEPAKYQPPVKQQPQYQQPQQQQTGASTSNPSTNFAPPLMVNLDDWSDFEDDE